MKKSNAYIVLLGILLLGILGFFLVKPEESVSVVPTNESPQAGANTLPNSGTPNPSATPPVKAPPVVSIPAIPASYNTYTSDKYDFSLGYPKTVTFMSGYSSFHRLNNEWRMGAPSNVQGTPLFQIDLYKVDHATPQGSPYPLFYTAVVRGAVSTNVKECYSVDGGNSKLTGTQNIGGVEWKVFTYNDAAMMQYVKSKNYRTIKAGVCYVLEQASTGSTYRDSTMKDGMSDAALQTLFDSGFGIIKTFRFK